MLHSTRGEPIVQRNQYARKYDSKSENMQQDNAGQARMTRKNGG